MSESQPTTSFAGMSVGSGVLASSVPPTLAGAADREAGAGDALHASGRFAEAQQRFTAAIRLEPARADLHLRLAIAAWAAGDRATVDRHLLEAVRLSPKWATAHEALSQSYLERGLIEPALTHVRIAAALAPNDTSVQVSLAFVLEQAAQPEAAWAIIMRLVSLGVEQVRLASLYARMAPDHQQAEPALGMVMRLQRARRGTPRDASDLHFAAAPLLERLGLFDDAFAHARKANLLRGVRYDPVPDEAMVERQIRYFTRERVAALPRTTLGSKPIVLVVGMPRSGTSLVEQILASHPKVHGAGELPHLTALALSMGLSISPGQQSPLRTASPYPESLDALTREQADACAAQYLRPVLALAPPTASRIVDKMPLNLHCLGLAAALLPQARVIWCRRDPMDTCLSCYFTNFGAGQEFSYDLANVGRYHRLCDRLMAHWQSVLDLPILEVHYETLVTDPGAQVRRMIDFIDLPWDDHCLRPHETRRPVSTASAQQVRRPIYKTSVERWRPYERHLGELRNALAGDTTPR